MDKLFIIINFKTLIMTKSGNFEETEVEIIDSLVGQDQLDLNTNKKLSNIAYIFLVFGCVLIVTALIGIFITSYILPPGTKNESNEFQDYYTGVNIVNIIYENTCNPICDILGEQKKDYGDYQVSFNKKVKLPFYVKHRMTLNQEKKCNYKFYPDPDINTYNPDNYIGEPYKRAHLVPTKDIPNCKLTFNMVNIVPMVGCVNTGIWRQSNEILCSYVGKTILTALDFHGMDEIMGGDENESDESNNPKSLMYVPKGFYRIVFDDNDNIIYNVYFENNESSCYKGGIRNVGNQNKLPDFI